MYGDSIKAPRPVLTEQMVSDWIDQQYKGAKIGTILGQKEGEIWMTSVIKEKEHRTYRYLANDELFGVVAIIIESDNVIAFHGYFTSLEQLAIIDRCTQSDPINLKD